MLCKNCNLKAICTTFKYISNTTYASIKVEQCHYYDSNKKDIMPLNDNSKQDSSQYCGQAKPDLRDIERKINNVEDKPKPVLIDCPTCKGKTYDDDLKICETCGKTICPNCSTNSDGHIYCDQCWNKK